MLAHWRVPRQLTAAARALGATGVERANRFVMILLVLQRLSYLAPTLLSTGATAFHRRTLNIALVATTVAWNVALFVDVSRRGWFRPVLVWVDVAWTAVLLIVVSANAGASYEQSSVNWSGRMAQAAAALAGAAAGPVILAALAVAVLLGAHTVALLAAMSGSEHLVPELVSCLNGLFWFAVIIGFVTRYLRRQGSMLDRLTDDKVAARARESAEHARYTARIAHYRALHDTVLSTLSAIACGGLDHRTEQVRQRAAREADYVRRLMLTDDESPGPLGDRLGQVVTDVEAVGLRVHYRLDPLPRPVPEDVAEAVSGATREALNNVVKHAGTRAAWLTATGADEAVLVRVVDRGVGFTPSAAGTGFGLPFSVSERMRSVGGTARVSSAPGDGTCVELVWSA